MSVPTFPQWWERATDEQRRQHRRGRHLRGLLDEGGAAPPMEWADREALAVYDRQQAGEDPK